jgi:hypothetical protein
LQRTDTIASRKNKQKEVQTHLTSHGDGPSNEFVQNKTKIRKYYTSVLSKYPYGLNYCKIGLSFFYLKWAWGIGKKKKLPLRILPDPTLTQLTHRRRGKKTTPRPTDPHPTRRAR